MAVKGKNAIPVNHLHKDWQRRIRCWFDQSMRKKRRARARLARTSRIYPRPVESLRPVVRCPTMRYNTKTRLGRGFTLDELKAAGVHRLEARKYGNPIDVLDLVDTPADVIRPDLGSEEVLVEFQASPINPADINTIQGVYAIKPKLPAVGGNEGCADVLKIGSSVQNLQIGDRVVMRKSASGTWQTHFRSHFNDVIKVDKRLDAISASQTIVNPSTAYRMLKDYEALNQGDTVIQNGANSAVGRNVIQFCKNWNLVTVNVIRNRANKQELDELIDELKGLGANYVITEEQLESKDHMASLFKQIAKPKLALNCVGG